MAVKLPSAEVPQVDHRVGKRLERVMYPADMVESIQQAPEFIFQAEHPLNDVKPFVKNGWIEYRPATALGSFPPPNIRVDIRHHRAIENGFSIQPAIIDSVQADDGALPAQADRLGDRRHLWQGFTQHRGFIPISRGRQKLRDHIAIPGAENHHFVALDLLVSAEPDVVNAFLRGRRRAVTMDG